MTDPREPTADGDDEQTPPEPTGSEADEPSSLEAPEHDVPDESAAKPPRRIGARGVITIGARGIIGLLGVGVAVAAVIAATAVTGPSYRVTPPAASVIPVPAAQQRVCPGPLLRLGDESGQGATVATSVGRATAVYQAVPGSAEAESLATTDNPAGVAPLLLTLPPGETESSVDPALAGSQSQDADSGELVGLAAAECSEASGDTWLVGGATTVGRTTLVTISNPSTVAATVDVSIWGSAGKVAAPGAEGIIVAAGAQRIISLAGFAPGLADPVIRVQSRGGQVVANLQQTTVRTLEPGGVDIVGGTAPPARTVTIPGVVVGDVEAVSALGVEPGFEDLPTLLRLFVPGEGDPTAVVTITRDGTGAASADEPEATPAPTPLTAPGDPVTESAPDGRDVRSSDEVSFELELTSGEVTDVPLLGLVEGGSTLVEGSYTVTVESDAPLVAGARASTITADGATDFAWSAAATALGKESLLSVAPGPSPTLHLANPTDSDARVTVESDSGELTLEVPSGESVAAPLEAGSEATMSGPAGLVASVSYRGAGKLASFRVTPPGPASGAITVYR